MNEDLLNKAINSACVELMERFGLDTLEVLYTRQEGELTYSGSSGHGNFLARVRLCESFVRKANIIDDEHYREDLQEPIL